MTQRDHVRHVEIRTLTATCDDCDIRSLAKGIDTLIGEGWRLVGWSARETPRDLCPDCAEVAAGLERATAENEARARYIAQLEAGDPLLVHGRAYAGTAEHYRRSDIDIEIAKALDRRYPYSR